MAIIGGAVFAPLMGLISQTVHSLAVAYAIPLAAYLFITYYAFVGSRIGIGGA